MLQKDQKIEWRPMYQIVARAFKRPTNGKIKRPFKDHSKKGPVNCQKAPERFQKVLQRSTKAKEEKDFIARYS